MTLREKGATYFGQRAPSTTRTTDSSYSRLLAARPTRLCTDKYMDGI